MKNESPSFSSNEKKSALKHSEKKESNTELFQNYGRYRWFYTHSGKFVYGGKSAEQNDEVVRKLIKDKKNYIMMHTKIPGSPFAVILEPMGHVTIEDMEQTAIWTACFSRAWRSNLNKTVVDIFLTEQLEKKSGMNMGTFGVIGKIDRMPVDLKLVLTEQHGILRAVPEKSVKGKKLLKIVPGDIQKDKFVDQIIKSLKLKDSQKDELLNALPTGGFRIVK